MINDQEENNYEEYVDGDVHEIYDSDIEQSSGDLLTYDNYTLKNSPNRLPCPVYLNVFLGKITK